MVLQAGSQLRCHLSARLPVAEDRASGRWWVSVAQAGLSPCWGGRGAQGLGREAVHSIMSTRLPAKPAVRPAGCAAFAAVLLGVQPRACVRFRAFCAGRRALSVRVRPAVCSLEGPCAGSQGVA